jgi:colicin import membrane protein
LGLIISVILHAAILGWAFITIQSQRELRALEPEPIVTALVSEGDLTRLKQGVRTAKHLEAAPKDVPNPDAAKKDAPKPKPTAAPPPPPPSEPKADAIAEKLASAQVPPAPAAEEQNKLDAMVREQAQKAAEQKRAEEQRLAEEHKRAEEQKRAEEERRQAELKRKADEERKQQEAAARKKREEDRKRRQAELKRKQEEEKRRQEMEAKAKRKFDPDAIEKQLALLDRDPRKKNAAAATPPPESETKQKGPTLGAPEGRDQKISASELAMIGQIIRSCVASKWNVLSGGISAQETLVKIRLRFNPDGTLNRAPEVMNPQSTSYFVAISESAVRAVQDCEPFNLPSPRYEVWKDIVINFQPKDMF